MTRTEFIDAKNATGEPFGSNDFAACYDVSDEEADRILAAVDTVEQFETVWAHAGWWQDDAINV